MCATRREWVRTYVDSSYLRLALAKLPGATTLNEVEALLPRHVDPELLRDASQFSTTD